MGSHRRVRLRLRHSTRKTPSQKQASSNKTQKEASLPCMHSAASCCLRSKRQWKKREGKRGQAKRGTFKATPLVGRGAVLRMVNKACVRRHLPLSPSCLSYYCRSQPCTADTSIKSTAHIPVPASKAARPTPVYLDSRRPTNRPSFPS